MPLAISILGVTGRMGQCILTTALRDPDILIVAGTSHPHSKAIGTDLGHFLNANVLNLYVSADPQQALTLCDVAIDFSVSPATFCHIEAALATKKPLVIGTTGHTNEERRAIEKAAQDIPIIASANFSLGISLCLEIAASLSRTLFGNCYIDIFETHHQNKKDRPSGTALAFAHAIGKGEIKQDLHSPRNKEEIAIHSIRSGEIIGEHHVIFECGHERIEVKHTAHTRETFARGALFAAKQLITKPPGLYSLKDLVNSTV